jgi:hypothetical protein
VTSQRLATRRRPSTTTFTGTAAAALRRSVTGTVFVIAGLTFMFGFGNGYTVGVQLGVPGWIAPLVAPAVDLSVVSLLAALQYLRASGTTGRLVGPRLLLIFCGLTTLAINTVGSIAAGEFGRACFDAVAPLLLIGWSEVGPHLLASLQGTVPGPSRTTDEKKVAVSEGLVARARRLDMKSREQEGRAITRDKLRASLRVSNAVAGELLKLVRADARDQQDG